MSTIKIAMSFKERFPKCCPFSFKFVKILRWRNNKKLSSTNSHLQLFFRK